MKNTKKIILFIVFISSVAYIQKNGGQEENTIVNDRRVHTNGDQIERKEEVINTKKGSISELSNDHQHSHIDEEVYNTGNIDLIELTDNRHEEEEELNKLKEKWDKQVIESEKYDVSNLSFSNSSTE